MLALLPAVPAAGACGKLGSKPSFKGIDITGAEYASTLELPDPTASCAAWPTSRARWWWCSSATPSARMSAPPRWPNWPRSSAAGRRWRQVQGIFVTVDPERDTPEVLKAYVGNFGPTSSPARHARADQGRPRSSRCSTTRCRARPTQLHHGPHAGSYMFDTQGKVRLFTRYGSGAERAGRRPEALLLNERRLRRRSGVSSALRIFFIAATSIWRMRSALTPYSAASSCSVMPPELSSLTFSQRSRRCGGCARPAPPARVAMPSPASSRAGALRARASARGVVGQVGDRGRSFLAVVVGAAAPAATSPPDRRVSISITSSGLTFSSRATASISAAHQRVAVGVGVGGFTSGPASWSAG
jgi:protein SCO1/2